MHQKFIFLTALLTVFLPGSMGAAILEIPLEVTTPPDPFTTVVIPFAIDVPISQVSQIALRLQGTYNDQFFVCDVPYHNVTLPGRVKLVLGDEVVDAPEVELIHGFPANDGEPLPFDFTEILLAGDSSEWLFLADGSSQLGITDWARTAYYEEWYPCGPVEIFGTLSEATMIVTYDPGTPNQTTRWGTIKALYR
jgi:hypothetical protein